MDTNKVYQILHIEDNPADVRLVDIYLNETEADKIKEQLNFEIKLTNVTSMQEAYALENKEQFSVALCDLSLPDTFGIETLLKFKEKFPDCPTIVLTGSEDKKIGIEALKVGADDYLVKGPNLDSYILIKSLYYARIRQDNEVLRQAKDVAEQTAEVKQEILANMSHELRTPLNVVINIASLLKDVPDEHTREEYVNTLIISSKKLRILINSTLDLMKSESGKIELEWQPFTPKEMLNDLMDMYKYKARDKGLALYPKIDPFLPPSVIGDAGRLNQVFINLLDNAMKFTHEGELEIGAKLMEDEPHDAMIKFYVKDTGIGIEQEKADKIFESFVQASESTERLYGGTGLGLSISQEIIRLHGSKIEVKSEVGVGSVFSFILSLPKNITPVVSKPKPTMPNAPVNLETAMKILLVEDHKPNQMIARQLLKKWTANIDLDIADNGKIAVDKVKANNYDIILMDVSMPVMNGFEATRMIRQLPAPKGTIPIVAMTAHALESKRKECFDSGMNDFITKPIEPSLMYDSINKYVGKDGSVAVSVSETEAIEDNGPKGSENIGISYKYFDDLASGDEEFKRELIDIMVTDIKLEMEKLEEAFKGGFITYYNIAHKLKTSYSYLGLRDHPLVKATLWRPEEETPDVKVEPSIFQEFLTFGEKVLKQVRGNQ